ncbi:MAG: hypothetical protein [Olavius algarvensis Gamma 3 endosymbiont]|nr:MAG: hypothetical protein [Olavius algarvensis Gamma 3 endosymbiont]
MTQGSAAKQAWQRQPGQPPKILVVDDEPRVLRSLQAALRSKFEVITAEGAKQAKQILADAENIDIVVSDERMPHCTGLELLQWCRENRPDCIRILLSSTDFAKKRDAISAADVYRCIPKPWNIQEFTEVLNRAALVTEKQKRRAVKERDSNKREQRSGLSRHRALAILDQDATYREAFKQVVDDITELSDVYCFDSAETVSATMQHATNIGIVVIDPAAGDEAAVDLIQDIKKRNPGVAVIVTSNPSSLSEFMPKVSEREVHNFIAKPLSAKRIQPVVADALKHHFIKIRKN